MRNECPGNGAGDCRFEILCQSATATEPCESTFDNPSAWQNFEALRRVRTLDDFYRPFADALQSLAQFISSIATIGKDMAQPGIARTDRSKNAGGAIAILNAGFVNDESDQVALGVGDDVALTALDSLARIKAPWATAFCGFHRLAVNHSGRRARLSTSRLTRCHDESVVPVRQKFHRATRRKNSPAPSSRVGSPSAIAAIGNRWTQCRGSHLSPFACLLHVAQALKQAAAAAPSQTTLHQSYRFHIASPRAYNVDE